MNIYINEKAADITLDTEKTLGDVMSGIELWISPTGSRIRKISVNGKDVLEDELGEVFRKDIADIEKLDVFIRSLGKATITAELRGLSEDSYLTYEGSANRDTPNGNIKVVLLENFGFDLVVQATHGFKSFLDDPAGEEWDNGAPYSINGGGSELRITTGQKFEIRKSYL